MQPQQRQQNNPAKAYHTEKEMSTTTGKQMQEGITALMNSTYTVTKTNTRHPDHLPAPSLSQELERPWFQAIQNHVKKNMESCFFSQRHIFSPSCKWLPHLQLLHLAECLAHVLFCVWKLCLQVTGRRLYHFIRPTYSSSVLSNDIMQFSRTPEQSLHWF